MKRTRIWLLVFILIMAVSFGVILSGRAKEDRGSKIAGIYQEGSAIYSIALDSVKKPYSIKIKGEKGINTVTVEPGRICVSEADCPDKSCVNCRWISKPGQMVVCLPNRLMIKIKNEAAGGIDGLSR
ncbi:hypothetical protein CLHUN_08040 [Ruminiclostridium hungatei]|uniref:Uncharacterized protein n=1 Tax=Ruminiclostridium hungatei TaxID=48256 RepID=A0A1V4SNL6_RUMHU|nr:NusG domain II-containing protein [Ruminiclostridium hungatei]OPX45434.1 hypothetical protein CLHUN_08040 [Ruminiclostridium hungatei]